MLVKVDRSGPRSARERAVLRYARRGGIPVPHVLFADPGPPGVLVLEYIRGVPLSEDSADESWTAAGRVLRKLHDLEPPSELELPGGSESWCAHMTWWAHHEIDSLRGAGLLDTETGVRLARATSDAFSAMHEPPLVMAHMDCQPDHWLINLDQSRVAGIVDFGDTAIGDPMWDLTVLTLWQPSKQHLVLAGYQPANDLTDRLRQLDRPYRLLRHLGAASWLSEHGLDPQPDLTMANHLATRGTSAE